MGSFRRGALKTGESETDGLQRVLAELLSPTADQGKTAVAFDVVDLISTWWRPDHDERLYPYQPVVRDPPTRHQARFRRPVNRSSRTLEPFLHRVARSLGFCLTLPLVSSSTARELPKGVHKGLPRRHGAAGGAFRAF